MIDDAVLGAISNRDIESSTMKSTSKRHKFDEEFIAKT